MEPLDTQRTLEALERLQAKLRGKGEAPAQEKLSLLQTVLQSSLFRVDQICVSLNGGQSRGLRSVAHDDSYTRGQRDDGCPNPAAVATVTLHRGGSSASSYDDASSEPEREDLGTRLTPELSQFCTPPRMSRHISMGRNLSAIASERRHVELIELENDGSGLGFGIVGGRNTGVVVKTILPSGAAGRDQRLRRGDQILCIGDEDVAGASCEAAAQLLWNAGDRVRLLIARDDDDNDNDNDASSPALSWRQETVGVDAQVGEAEQDHELEVQFTKNTLGLGVTVTGYRGDVGSGVLVKSIVKGSAVDQDGRVHIGDRILAVDGVSLQGCSELTALDVLRRTGPRVHLRLARTPVRPADPLPPAPAPQPVYCSHSGGGQRHRGPHRALGTAGTVRSLREISKRAAYAHVHDHHCQDAKEAVKLSAAEEEALRRRWQRALGPRYEVMVCQLERFSETSGLGISVEARAGHHYLRSVLPEGPVGQSARVYTGDQILEVNGVPLVGETHQEVVSVLRELPVSVRLVCCRLAPPPPAPPPDSSDEEDDVQRTLTELLAEFNDALERSCCAAEDHGKRCSAAASPPLAMWERDVQVVELQKGEAGLGFSILDYQDPEDPAKTVLVIRSLVPGGVADRDGGLLPGDRLMSVNDADLESSSLDFAVQVLKSAADGAVRIGVAKPLPLEAYDAAPVAERVTESPPAREEYDALAGPPSHANARSSERNGQQRYTLKRETQRQRHGNMEGGDKLHAPPPPKSGFERTITVVRGNRSLGMSVSAVKDGSAMLVRGVVQGGSVSQDGRLGVGDSILALNGEPFSANLTNARARAVLRRHSVIGPDMSVTYVPASQVDEHRACLSLPPLGAMATDGPCASSARPSPSPKAARAPRTDPRTAPRPTLTPTQTPKAAPAPASHTSVTYVPASQVDEHPACLSLPPLAAMATDGPCASSARPSPSPQAPRTDPGPAPRPTLTPTQTPKAAPAPASHTSYKTPKAPPEPRVRGEDGVAAEVKRQEEEKPQQAKREATEVREEDKGEEEEEEEEPAYPTILSWSEPRRVQLRRGVPGQCLGISIMGGRRLGSRLRSGEMMRGVFVKHITQHSPAGLDGTLRTWDRILEVGGVDLRDASHEQAVEAIRRSGDPVIFLVQSGQRKPQLSPVLSNHGRLPPHPEDNKVPESPCGLFLSLSPTNPFTPTPFKPTANRSARRSPTIAAPPIAEGDAEDEFGYSWKKVRQRYGSLPGELLMVELERRGGGGGGGPGLGLSLTSGHGGGAGDGPRARASVRVASVDPRGAASADGRIRPGDELLEINGQILYGRSHQNASSIIDRAPAKVKIILLRNKAAVGHMTLGAGGEHVDPPNSQTEADAVPSPKDMQHAVLPQDHVGLGLNLGEEDGRGAAVIRSLTPHDTASRDGRIRAGDRLPSVDDVAVMGMSVDKVSSLPRTSKSSVKLSITSCHPVPRSTSCSSANHPAPLSSSSSSSSTAPTANNSPSARSDWLAPDSVTPDPLTCPIKAGCESRIEICKGHTGLGLSIVGGCDTLLGAVIIHEVNDGGAAQRDGRLWAGDQILEVNGLDLRQATHEEAIGVLRLTPQRVRMRVFRHQEAYREEDLWDVFPLELRPRPGQALGLGTVGKSDDTGVFVAEIVRGGVADLDGRLLPGDQILSVNGEDVRAAKQDHVGSLLQSCSGVVQLEVARFKAALHSSPGSQSGHNADSAAPPPSSSGAARDALSHQREAESRGGRYAPGERQGPRTVVLHKGPHDSLGISVAGGVGSPHGNIPLFIATMETTGPAAKTQQLQIGDRIVSINGVPTEGMTQVHAGVLLKNAGGTITLQVLSGSGCGMQNQSDGVCVPSSPGQPSGVPSFHNNLCVRVYKTLTLERGPSGLGFSIVGGFGSPHGDLPIYVKTLFSKGAAIEDGGLKCGDQIIAVNGHCLEGVTHAEAVDILKRTKGTVVLALLS